MKSKILLVLALCILAHGGLGCAVYGGSVQPAPVEQDEGKGEQTASQPVCKGVWFSFGNTVGPCGLMGGGLTEFGKDGLLGTVTKAADAGIAFLTRQPPQGSSGVPDHTHADHTHDGEK